MPSETPVRSDPDGKVAVETSADTSLSQALKAVAEFTEAVALIQAAVAEIDTKRVSAITDIETKHDEVISDIQTKQVQAIAAIQLEKSGALQALQAALPNITQLVQNAVNSLFGQDRGYSS